MIYKDTATLISESYTTNEIGDAVATETERTVFICVKSVGMKRKLEAEAFGLKLEWKFVIANEVDYNGEEIIIYNGIRYNIVDVYIKENREVELTVKRY